MDPGAPAAGAPLVTRPSVRRQNASKLSHLIARELRGMIVRGELVPGQALPSEGHLLRTFEVSRDTLREALRILESESLILVRRGRRGGAVVEQPHRRSVTRHVALLLQVQGATVSEVQEARLVIEPPAAGRLAERPLDAVDAPARVPRRAGSTDRRRAGLRHGACGVRSSGVRPVGEPDDHSAVERLSRPHRGSSVPLRHAASSVAGGRDADRAPDGVRRRGRAPECRSGTGRLGRVPDRDGEAVGAGDERRPVPGGSRVACPP